MGWRGTLRAIEASARRAEREEVRERKRLLAAQKLADKMNELERAQNEVEVYENHIATLLSIHKQCSEPIDWQILKNKPLPNAPINENRNEQLAIVALQSYKPSFFDKLFRLAEGKQNKLKIDINTAIKKDKDEFKQKSIRHAKELCECQSLKELAEGVISGDLSAYSDALDWACPFSDINDLGASIKINFNSTQLAEVGFHANGPAIVPTEFKSLLKSGKLSIKKMSTTVYWEYYQDYVCSCILRIGRELFAVLPISKVVVTATSEILNTATGHMESTPIISILLVRDTMGKLNFEQLDCSDSFRNFVHNMEFKRGLGFSAVEKVTAN